MIPLSDSEARKLGFKPQNARSFAEQAVLEMKLCLGQRHGLEFGDSPADGKRLAAMTQICERNLKRYAEAVLSGLIQKVEAEWEQAEKPSPRAEYLLIVSLWLKRELAESAPSPEQASS
jgi:hypothetical protein